MVQYVYHYISLITSLMSQVCLKNDYFVSISFQTIQSLPWQLTHPLHFLCVVLPVELVSPSPVRHISLVANEKMVTGLRPSTCLITGS